MAGGSVGLCSTEGYVQPEREMVKPLHTTTILSWLAHSAVPAPNSQEWQVKGHGERQQVALGDAATESKHKTHSHTWLLSITIEDSRSSVNDQLCD